MWSWRVRLRRPGRVVASGGPRRPVHACAPDIVLPLRCHRGRMDRLVWVAAGPRPHGARRRLRRAWWWHPGRFATRSSSTGSCRSRSRTQPRTGHSTTRPRTTPSIRTHGDRPPATSPPNSSEILPDSEVEFRSRLQERGARLREGPSGKRPEGVLLERACRGSGTCADPARALDETKFDGRSRTVTGIGLAHVLRPPSPRARRAVAGATPPRAVRPRWWRSRSRPRWCSRSRPGTRYRAPFETVIVVLARSNIAPLLRRRADAAVQADARYSAA